MLFATDTRCSYANVVVPQGAVRPGVKTVEALGDEKLVRPQGGAWRRPPSAPAPTCTASTCCKSVKAPDGKAVNDHVEWVGGGASTTMLGGLKAGKFDAIMAVPEWQSAAVSEGFGNGHLRYPGREGVEPRLRRPHPGDGGLRA
jgi:hypothetical protein